MSESHPSHQELEHYLEFASTLARQAGAQIRIQFSQTIAKSWKADASIITKVDDIINDLVLARIGSTYPDHSIISEEGSDTRESDFTWICDPLDGTLPFAHGIPTSTFVLALTHHGKPLIGVIYDPFLDRLVTAAKDQGAQLNGRPVRVALHDTIDRSVINVDPWQSDAANLHRLAGLIRQKHGWPISFTSYNYTALLVATGRIAGSVGPSDKPWDAAAASIIVKEAGGRATSLSGEDQRYDKKVNGLLIGNESIHEQLAGLLKGALE